MLTRRRLLASGAAGLTAGLAVGTGGARAQADWPSKPVQA